MELNWPFKRHYEIFAGIRDFAEKHAEWTFDLNRFPEFDLARGKRFDGIVGRIGKDCLMAARKAGIPVVNVWIDSPVADKVPGVNFDTRAAGRLAAEHLIVRGFRHLAHFGFRGSADSKQHDERMCEVAREHGYPCTSHATYPSFNDKAARLLNDLMRGKKPPLDPLLIPPKELVVRKSTDFHAVSDPRVARALSHMFSQSAEKLSVSGIAQFAGVGRQTLERGSSPGA